MPWFKVDDRLYSHPKLAALEGTDDKSVVSEAAKVDDQVAEAAAKTIEVLCERCGPIILSAGCGQRPCKTKDKGKLRCVYCW